MNTPVMMERIAEGSPRFKARIGLVDLSVAAAGKPSSPYNLSAGVLGEGSLTLWLLVMGVNAQRWKEQASAAGERRS